MPPLCEDQRRQKGAATAATTVKSFSPTPPPPPPPLPPPPPPSPSCHTCIQAEPYVGFAGLSELSGWRSILCWSTPWYLTSAVHGPVLTTSYVSDLASNTTVCSTRICKKGNAYRQWQADTAIIAHVKRISYCLPDWTTPRKPPSQRVVQCRITSVYDAINDWSVALLLSTCMSCPLVSGTSLP